MHYQKVIDVIKCDRCGHAIHPADQCLCTMTDRLEDKIFDLCPKCYAWVVSLFVEAPAPEDFEPVKEEKSTAFVDAIGENPIELYSGLLTDMRNSGQSDAEIGKKIGIGHATVWNVRNKKYSSLGKRVLDKLELYFQKETK